MMLPIYDKVLQKSRSMKYKKLEEPRPKPLLKAASHRTGYAGSGSIQFWYVPEKRYALSSNSLKRSTNTNKFLLKIKNLQVSIKRTCTVPL